MVAVCRRGSFAALWSACTAGGVANKKARPRLPLGIFGARNWLRLSGMKVHVTGSHYLDPARTYVFISNHRSYLDTATLFVYTGRRLGLLAKKELLNVPILGVGMGFVNIMAIDRSNSERARVTVAAATERIRSGISFAVFAEGTRANLANSFRSRRRVLYGCASGGAYRPRSDKEHGLLDGQGNGRGARRHHRDGHA